MPRHDGSVGWGVRVEILPDDVVPVHAGGRGNFLEGLASHFARSWPKRRVLAIAGRCAVQ